jgi:hypothetical protein
VAFFYSLVWYNVCQFEGSVKDRTGDDIKPILPLGRTGQGLRHPHRAERMGDHNTDEFFRRDFVDRLIEIMGDAGTGEKEIDAAPIEASAHDRAGRLGRRRQLWRRRTRRE